MLCVLCHFNHFLFIRHFIINLHNNCPSSWQFWTDAKDIGFGIFRRTSEEKQKAGDMDVVVASERVNSHLVPEEGSVEVHIPGTCQ